MSNSLRQRQLIGWYPTTPLNNNVTTLPLNAAATWLAYSFTAQAATFNAIRAFLSATAGTLAASDVTASLCADSSGSPGTVLEGPVSCATTPSGSGWYNWSGFSTAGAQSKGTPLWIVFKNVNGTPGTNFPTFQYLSTQAAGQQPLIGSTTLYGWCKKHSTNSGGAWGTQVIGSGGYRIDWSGSLYDGIPVSNQINCASLVYGTRELGLQFTAPGTSGLTYNVIGLAVGTAANLGTPTGSMNFNLRIGSSPGSAASTIALGHTNVGGGWMFLPFSATQTVTGGQVVNITIADSASNTDNASNCYRGIETQFDSDSNSATTMPLGATGKLVYFDGTSWTTTATSAVCAALVLDPDTPFTVAPSAPKVMAG